MVSSYGRVLSNDEEAGVLRGLLRACHPEPAAAVTLVGGVLAVGAGLSAWQVAGVTATVGTSQLAVGWSNDAIDAPRDATVGRTDKPVPSGLVSRRVLFVGAAIAAAACVTLAFATSVRAAPVYVVALVSALLYNWPLKSTVASPVPYAVSFGCLPAFVVLVAGREVPWWLPAAGALLGVAAHFANVVPDLADDARTGVRGLPHRFGATGSLAASAVLLAAVTALLVFGPPGPPRPIGWIAGALTVAVLLIGGNGLVRGGRQWAFRAVLVVAVLDVVLLVGGGVLG
nr:UbiA family prenyltransferase [Virgisporangium aliadipatigenens]